MNEIKLHHTFAFHSRLDPSVLKMQFGYENLLKSFGTILTSCYSTSDERFYGIPASIVSVLGVIPLVFFLNL